MSRPRDVQGNGKIAELEQKLQRQRNLIEVLRELPAETALDGFLVRVMEQATALVDAERSSLCLYDAGAGELANIPDACQDARFNPEWDEKTGFRTRSVLAVPMRSRNGQVIGVLQVLNKQGATSFTPEDEEFLGALAANAGIFVENARLHQQIEGLCEAFVNASIGAIDEGDPATCGQSARVSAYAMNLARLVHEDDEAFANVRFTREALRKLRFASVLHDSGKIGLRESVLRKANGPSDAQLQLVLERLDRLGLEARMRALQMELQGLHIDEEALFLEHRRIARRRELIQKVNMSGLEDEQAAELDLMLAEGVLTLSEYGNLSIRQGNLSEAEWEDMRSHVSRTFSLLERVPWPEGLSREEIPLGGLIMMIADAYDALTASGRPCHRALSHEQACAIMREEARRGRLDGELVELFIGRDAWKLTGEERPVELDVLA